MTRVGLALSRLVIISISGRLRFASRGVRSAGREARMGNEEINDAVIEVAGLAKSFGGVPAVNGVTFSVSRHRGLLRNIGK